MRPEMLDRSMRLAISTEPMRNLLATTGRWPGANEASPRLAVCANCRDAEGVRRKRTGRSMLSYSST
jgi:hypothetical protein